MYLHKQNNNIENRNCMYFSTAEQLSMNARACDQIHFSDIFLYSKLAEIAKSGWFVVLPFPSNFWIQNSVKIRWFEWNSEIQNHL